ncbi:MAG: histidine kinase, partial [Chitinophagales bacterium]|nr:histidine kinase [Chitinophagales bacterium]
MILNSVQLFLKNYDSGNKPVFSHKQNHISFDYVGLFYSNPERVTYQYKLSGYNSDWIHTHDRFITFPNLSPGNYRFRVRSAIDNNYKNSKIVTYAFKIQKPYWEEAWFFVAIILSIVGLLYFIVRVREQNYKRTEKLKKERIEFQFETLKAQINPHFLFNSFNTLATLIEEDQKISVQYVDKLSDFYRSILSYKDVDLIPLKEEWELGMNYIFLLHQRHGDRLKFIVGEFEKSEDLFIPPLSIQILIENAVKHNIISRDRPLTVRIYMQDERTLVVENNLQLKPVAPPSTKIGLGSISERLVLSGGVPLKTFQDDDKFKVQITLIIKNKSHENSFS